MAVLWRSCARCCVSAGAARRRAAAPQQPAAAPPLSNLPRRRFSPALQDRAGGAAGDGHLYSLRDCEWLAPAPPAPAQELRGGAAAERAALLLRRCASTRSTTARGRACATSTGTLTSTCCPPARRCRRRQRLGRGSRGKGMGSGNSSREAEGSCWIVCVGQQEGGQQQRGRQQLGGQVRAAARAAFSWRVGGWHMHREGTGDRSASAWPCAESGNSGLDGLRAAA
jgi:hypothetical protein